MVFSSPFGCRPRLPRTLKPPPRAAAVQLLHKMKVRANNASETLIKVTPPRRAARTHAPALGSFVRSFPHAGGPSGVRTVVGRWPRDMCMQRRDEEKKTARGSLSRHPPADPPLLPTPHAPARPGDQEPQLQYSTLHNIA